MKNYKFHHQHEDYYIFSTPPAKIDNLSCQHHVISTKYRKNAKKRSQQIDLLTDFILHIFMIFLNLSFELCFVLKSICIFVQLSNQIIETMLILHLGNDIFHRLI